MDNEAKTIPWIAHEGEVTRLERANRRMFVLCIIIFIALVVTNGGWIWFESQWEDVSTTVTQDVDSGLLGDAIINDGVHIYGESETDGNN